MHRGYGAQSQVPATIARIEHSATILWQSSFRDVHPSKNLGSGEQRFPLVFRQTLVFLQFAVDTQAHE